MRIAGAHSWRQGIPEGVLTKWGSEKTTTTTTTMITIITTTKPTTTTTLSAALALQTPATPFPGTPFPIY